MSIDLIISIGGFIIACASLIYTYAVKRKIDAQILKINDKTLSKLQSEESEKKKAKFKLNFHRLGGGRFKLGVKNIGLADARNVSILDMGDDDRFMVHLSKHMFPIELFQSNTEIELNVAIMEGHKPNYKMKIIWDDDFQNNRNEIIGTPIF